MERERERSERYEQKKMPRCFTIRKHSAQHNSMQQPQQHEQHHQPSRKIVGNADGKNSEDCDGKKTHRKVAVIQVGKARFYFLCPFFSISLATREKIFFRLAVVVAHNNSNNNNNKPPENVYK